MIMVGSVTGNDNTVGGGGVYPIADLRELEGLAQGARNVSTFSKIVCQSNFKLILNYQPISMMDGYKFNGAKAYKDSKLAIMMTSNILHEK